MTARLSLLFVSILLCGYSLTAMADDDRTQTRATMQRVVVPVAIVEVDDGDTVTLRWSEEDEEIIRILGIDTPETQHVSHNLPYDQSFGREAAGFAKGAFASATQVELLRSETTDGYGRTLGYLFVNGQNYSALIVAAGLAAESVTHYGDNGLPDEAAEVLAAAESAGPIPFEAPYKFRRRMRDVTEWMKEHGRLPDAP